MGFFDKFFGRKPQPPPERAGVGNADDDFDQDADNVSFPIDAPPDFVRAAKMHLAYWTHDAEEQARLTARDIGDLSWPELLRLHHLVCLERRSVSGEARQQADLLCRNTFARLSADESPYRPREALVWQGPQAQAGNQREPDIAGELSNLALTHLGALEFLRLDARLEPTSVQFAGFDDLAGVAFASLRIHRAAKLFYNDGRNEVVNVPLLYGLTWQIGTEYERSARMTRFVAHLSDVRRGPPPDLGIGVGQQDLTASGTTFGIGSVCEIAFPLDTRDRRFDEKARARGIDPDRVRHRRNDEA